ncbi:ABC transporter substrate-binding protein [Neptuniibacter sp.]|uniref:substrate-binding periplasmic protein n=1 Tax=Neptuniibacter sp. TaxID=1962643 RepID=UPI0026222765|nr:transporter substrate-binding domain-containing protein [Neptuniibacter sp.]MCP4596882.1 transporter substrate-binding domain-containing protein [Neptuniibacter sp.]
MRKSLILVLGLMFTVFVQAESLERTLRLGCVQWPPYISEKLPGKGFLAELSELIISASNQRLDVVIMPWKRVVQGVDTGELDGSLCMFKTEERKSRMHYIEPPLLIEQTVVFHRRDFTPQVEKLVDLNNYALGILDGSGYQKDEFIQKHPKLSVVNSFENMFKMLAKGRVDIVLAEYRNGMAVIVDAKSLNVDQFSVLPYSYQHTDVHIVISHNAFGSQELANSLSKVAGEVINSSPAKALYKRHGILELPELKPLAP